MQDRLRHPLQQLRGALTAIEQATNHAGPTLGDKRKALELFQGAKVELLTALAVIEAEFVAAAAAAARPANEG
jgi:hypothetical protein